MLLLSSKYRSQSPGLVVVHRVCFELGRMLAAGLLALDRTLLHMVFALLRRVCLDDKQQRQA
jgi:hypothetical protein